MIWRESTAGSGGATLIELCHNGDGAEHRLYIAYGLWPVAYEPVPYFASGNSIKLA